MEDNLHQQTGGREDVDPSFTPYTAFSSRWIGDLNASENCYREKTKGNVFTSSES